MFYKSYFPLRVAEGSPFMQRSHNLFIVLMLKQLVNFLFAIKLSSNFLQGSNIYKL